MKKITLIIAAFLITGISFGQGKSNGKGNGKYKPNKEHTKATKDKDVYRENSGKKQNRPVYDQNNNTNAGKYSKNIPNKVGQAFYRDYPNATNVTWTKDRGDWTATFGNGIYRSTAVYHANGQRKDTRTAVQRQDLPNNGTVWDKIFKRDRVTPTGEFVRIQRPGTSNDYYRTATRNSAGQVQYIYYDANGRRVNYIY